MKAVTEKLENIVGVTGVLTWEDLEVRGIPEENTNDREESRLRQAQISLAVAPETPVTAIVYPRTQEELANVIAVAHQHQWGILPCGSGSKLSWGGLMKTADRSSSPVNLVVSTQRLNRLIEHAVGDLTVTVEAGMNFAQLQKTLASSRQFLALDPTFPEYATLGGIVATADAGSWRQRYGGVRDMLLGLSFVRADGQMAKAGGRVVKNVAGYDLMKLFTGSFGTLGIISQVTFRVYPQAEASQTVILTGLKEGITQATKTLLASALTPISADLLSSQLMDTLRPKISTEMGSGMGLVVRFQSVKESVKEQSTRLLEVGQQLGLQGVIFSADDEAELWQKLPEPIWTSPSTPAIICKIGIRPSDAVTLLDQLDQTSQRGIGLIHAGSGIGWLRFDSLEMKPQAILEIRSFCQSHGGFLTILEAPVPLKQQLDVWGYNGNALDLMRRIKKQFDPENLLSPNRFVGSI